MWVKVLWNARRAAWHEQADSQRLRDGFKSIAETCARWPNPKVFLEHLPKRQDPNPNQSIGAGLGRERQADALRCRDAWLESLGMNLAGEPVEARA